MVSNEHLSDEVLRKYGLGQLSNDASTGIDLHLATCVECRERIKSLSGDELLNRMQQAMQLNTTNELTDAGVSQLSLPRNTVAYVPATNIPQELLSLEQYTDIRELGHGGMGVVYLATNTRLDRDEVLKVVNKSQLERNGSFERFDREIRTAARLNHPNIVTAYASQQVGEVLILSMEYVAGDDLAKVVKTKGPLTIVKACYFAMQAAKGLQHAHDRGLVHRDIKPSNLMLVREGKKLIVKILDFGLAKSTNKESLQADLTGSGHMLGTPSYMAPEQIRKSSAVDIRADIYALGCTIYTLLTGRPPFVDESIIAVLMAHTTEEPKPLHELRADVPLALSQVVAKMLAKSVQDRYQTPDDVVKALNPFVRAKVEGVPVVGTTTLRNVAQETTHIATRQPSTIVPLLIAERVRKRRRWPFVVGILAMFAMLAIGAAVLRIKTEMGTIELTELADDTTVTIDGELATLTWADGKQSAMVRVTPGMHKVEIKKDGFTASGEEVTLTSGGRKVVTARLEKTKATTKPAESSIDRLAELRGVGKDSWKIQNGILEKLNTDNSAITFGSPDWTDIVFEADVQVVATKFGEGIGLQVRTTRGASSYWAASENHRRGIYKWSDNSFTILNSASDSIRQIPLNTWETVRVRAEGDQLSASINGRVLAKVTDGELKSGFVGFRTFGVRGRMKNVRVTDLAGKTLWEGLPDLSPKPE